MSLSEIRKGKQHRPRRWCLYGVHGIGKTTFGASAPNAIFLPTEDGVGDIDCHSFPLLESFSKVMEAVESLYSEKHQYKTVVVDSLDWLEQLIWKHTCQTASVESIEDFGYGKGYIKALDVWRQFLGGMSALHAKGMSIGFIAHSKIERFQNPETDDYDRYSPRLHKHAAALIQEWCDEVFFATYKIHTKQVEGKFNSKTTKAIGGDERVIKTTERPSCLAKNRLSMPVEIPLDWNAYAQFFTSK